ncbi:type I CRISPR-associated protein Cas8a1/Csx8 [Peptostreptococcaceae bacterium OttesenSCG-928-C18]|nr:type I CRISPR-associated protein Cas8a1/Csx8 [Peptostreptococcaceae bacterium OttesenSCG-928-C18]
MLEPIDWRYSAAIVGLVQYFKFLNEEYDQIVEYEMTEDSLSYNRSDITEDRFLAFCEYKFSDDMHHAVAEEKLKETDEFSEEQIDSVNDKLRGNTIMKKTFGKLKFDGENGSEILKLIKESRNTLIKETFRYKENLYKNYCNYHLLLKEEQPHCRLKGYDLDEGRKSNSAAYQFNKNHFVGNDRLEFDFIPFAFTNTYDALFINNNWKLEELNKAKDNLLRILEKAENEKRDKGTNWNSRTLLFKTIVGSKKFIDYDVEIIQKSRDKDYYETVFIRKKAINILKSLNHIEFLFKSIKITDNYYINIFEEAFDCILNEVCTDRLIELLLKEGSFNYTIEKLIEINYKIKELDKEKGGDRMKGILYATKECSKEIVGKLKASKSENKVKTYRQKLISTLVAEDYERFCDILLQLSAYSGVSIPFAYDLFEDFEKNKDIAYTFVAALDVNTKNDNTVKEEDKQELGG